jgi:hypothetical protein
MKQEGSILVTFADFIEVSVLGNFLLAVSISNCHSKQHLFIMVICRRQKATSDHSAIPRAVF